MFNQTFVDTRQRIENFAKEQKHEYLTVEHLLLGLLSDPEAHEVLVACGVDLEFLDRELKRYLEVYVPKLNDKNTSLMMTKAYQRVLQRAIWQVQTSGQGREVSGVDVLVAIFKERDTQSVALLKAQGVSGLSVMRYLSHGQVQSELEEDTASEHDVKKRATKKDPLKEFTQNLNERAKNGLTDPLIGRVDEIERTAQVLCRRRKNNPLLVGDAGVGKTAIAEGLAWLIVGGKAPKALAETVIYSLDIGSLVAGTKFRGDFENRIKDLLKALKKQPNAVLFIDEIHTIIGAGSSMNSSMDVSNLIKPALANGELRCIGSTTFVEYRQIFEKDHALSRRFQKIDVVEPSIEDSIGILQGLKSHYESFHHVKYTDEAIKSAVELSKRHIHDRFLPDKAIDVIDEAGAKLRLKHTSLPNEADEGVIGVVDVAQIEEVVAKIARIPPKSVSRDDIKVLKNLEQDLKHVVFGQDEAIKKLSDCIKLARAGLKSANKPIGSFMFAGPTGVGKTEIARQLAFALGIELVRFDMSEYMEAHTASRLIGAPPGYVGYDQGGLLTEKIHQYPHCVLLLDEIEKAHPDVFNLLLQVMDNGTLTDNNGRSTSFKQVILIMTTNVGAESISRASMGFMEQDHSSDNHEAIKRAFTPEFRNRLDAVVQFSSLSVQVIGEVVDKFIIELQETLEDKNVILEVDDEVRAYLGEKGYDKLMGARPMARLITDELKQPLAQLILFGDLSEGGVVRVRLDDDKCANNDKSSSKLRFDVVKSA
ncbi:MAG: ATP-dependent Clp protease ATP-binding subunit ClpA [Moraxella sp.]|uniref:ATP-dependent Clp protease ATP-binding subunit ClpA n=1 Tax=Moraxella sp. TaxID=479 RepID=UPI0026DDB04C|nr:ATP-dependent Clp protease ATP-binding subunit ClpA [Moraxella sp.]MDO4449373.1 ATP-dependent Clp protease ATP-binding subunit ClpA [Moraxella sp.]